MSSVMLTAMPCVSKYTSMWLVFYLLFFKFLSSFSFRFLGAFAKLQKGTISFVLSVCPSVRNGTTRLPLERFSWNLVFRYFFENLSRMTRRKTVFYMKTDIYIWPYLTHFFLKCEMFQTKLYRKSNITFLVQYFFFFENCTAYEVIWKKIVEPGRSHMTIWCIDFFKLPT